MGSRRPSGHVDMADHLALGDPGADGKSLGQARHVGIERRVLGGMDLYGEPVLEISALMIDHTVGCRKNRLPHVRLVVEAIVKAASG